MQPNARAPLDTLTFYKQMGLEDVTVWTDPPNDNAEYYIGTKKHFADNGLNVYGMGGSSGCTPILTLFSSATGATCLIK